MPQGGVKKKKREREIGGGPREQYRSVPRGGVKKEKRGKKMIGRGPRERCMAIPRFGINNALQGRKERNSKGVWERAESRGLFVVSINKTRTVLWTDAHSSVLHTIELCFKAGHIWHTCPEERAEEAWLPLLLYILDRFVGFIDKFRHISTIFTFFLVSLWSRGWRSNPQAFWL